MTFQIKPITDIPQEDAKLLGHDKIIANLKTFLEHENMITPLSIAIHGEWGSGKTSIMKTLGTKLDKNKFEVMFFEAWKYEYANPSLGLVSELAEKFTRDRAIIHSILKAAIFILTNQYMSLDIENVIRIIKDSKQSTDTLSKQLDEIIKKNIGNKKLIIIIDDLDRCDVENTLQLLAVIKLFLDLENCICIAAVDFNRLKQAWRQKYNIPDGKYGEDGSEYLDKIFQIRIGIPKPPHDLVREYVKTLVENMPDSVAKLFATLLPKNPRAVKRIMNLISYRQNLIKSHYKEFSAIFWTLLEEIMTNEKIIYANDRIIAQGNTIGALIVNQGRSWASIKELFTKTIDENIIREHGEMMSQFFALSYDISLEFKIEINSLNDDFQILHLATNEALK